MAEQETSEQSLEKILHLMCDEDMEETYDHSIPFEPIKPSVNYMLSLLEVDFDSREDLLTAVHKTALMEGYVTVIWRSKPDQCVYIGCDRGGKYRDTRMVPFENRKRKTASRLIECPFEIVGRKKPEGFWKVDIKNLAHNLSMYFKLF